MENNYFFRMDYPIDVKVTNNNGSDKKTELKEKKVEFKERYFG